MFITVLLIALLVALAGVCNGITDTLQFHYTQSFARNWRAQYWNPAISWRNKYKRDASGELIRPLKPRFFGSNTFLVFLTDAWHLFKFLQAALLRLLMVWLVVSLELFSVQSKSLYVAGVYLILWGIQAAGFHLFYTILKKNDNEE